nr:DUF6629 family protein [uncultured Halomonas sp.]
MCFSANASFASSAIIAVVGMATLARTQHRSEWLFASLPLLFAWHQFNEGMVWLGLTGDVPIGSLQGWGFAYMLYAQGLLPLLIPLSVWLLEPGRHRQRLIVPFLLIGGGLTLYQLWALLNYGTDIYVREHSVVYHNPATRHRLIAVLYIIATCGALFFSGYRYIVGFGVANLLGLLVVIYFKQYAFTSVWCTYAAIVSVLIYGHFHLRSNRQAHANRARKA